MLLANKKGGPIYLIDYSMATTQRYHTGPACGKASYIAPEVLAFNRCFYTAQMHLGNGYDAFQALLALLESLVAQADAFSCGVILYALFAKDLATSLCNIFDFAFRTILGYLQEWVHASALSALDGFVF